VPTFFKDYFGSPFLLR